jgi:hypothetical protein
VVRTAEDFSRAMEVSFSQPGPYLLEAIVWTTSQSWASLIFLPPILAELREADLKKSIVSIKTNRGKAVVEEGTGFVV